MSFDDIRNAQGGRHSRASTRTRQRPRGGPRGLLFTMLLLLALTSLVGADGGGQDDDGSKVS